MVHLHVGRARGNTGRGSAATGAGYPVRSAAAKRCGPGRCHGSSFAELTPPGPPGTASRELAPTASRAGKPGRVTTRSDPPPDMTAGLPPEGDRPAGTESSGAGWVAPRTRCMSGFICCSCAPVAPAVGAVGREVEHAVGAARGQVVVHEGLVGPQREALPGTARPSGCRRHRRCPGPTACRCRSRSRSGCCWRPAG